MSLRVATQLGPYLHSLSRVSDVWSLRILIISCLDCDQSFLLIAWLLWLRNAAKIVTAHLVKIGEYLRMLQVFQHLVGFL